MMTEEELEELLISSEQEKNEDVTHDIQGVTVRFAPCEAPPFTHRVRIDGKPTKHWLEWRYDPASRWTAKYYHALHVLGEEHPDWRERGKRRPRRAKPWSQEAFARWCLLHQFDVVGRVGRDAYKDLPFERYFREVPADTWKPGGFRRSDPDGAYMTYARWMDRFNAYCEEQLSGEVLGCQVRDMLLHREAWDHAPEEKGDG